MQRRFRRMTIAGGLVALLMAITASAALAAPEAKTVDATDIGPHSAALQGEVLLNEQSALAGFEYGETTAYGSESDVTEVAKKTGWRFVYTKIAGLEPGTTYHYRFAAYVGNGYVYGQDKTFTTTQPVFTAEEYPAILGGGGMHADPPVIGVESGSFNCDTGISGKMTTDAGSIEVTPSFEKCWLAGTEATVAVNGCSYVFNAGSGTTGSMDINCPAGKSITITAGPCGMSIPAQTGLNAVDSQVESSIVDHPGVRFDLDVSGLEYVKTKDGFLCKFAGTGTKNDGTFGGGFGLLAESEFPATNIDLGFVES